MRDRVETASDFSRTLIDRSGYADEGFADLYDRFRPAPPEALLEIVSLVAQVRRPRLVVDLGAGTGLSTRVWSQRADEVVGVEANAAMIARARAATDASNVRYVEAFASGTGLADDSADIATCAQAFHWMDPTHVLAESARILRPGGVFAAYDYDVPPVVQPAVDDAFATHFQARRAARERLGLPAGSSSWPKEGHLGRIRESGLFRFAREIVCHGVGVCDAGTIVGLAESVGGPKALFGGGAAEVEETFERLRDVAERELGTASHTMVACYRIRVGVK